MSVECCVCFGKVRVGSIEFSNALIMSRQLIVVKPPTITFERSVEVADIFEQTRLPTPQLEAYRSVDYTSSHHFNDANLDEITDLWLKEISVSISRKPKTPLFSPARVKKQPPSREEPVYILKEKVKKLNRRTRSDNLHFLTQSPNPLLKTSRQFSIYRKHTSRSPELKKRRTIRTRGGEVSIQAKLHK